MVADVSNTTIVADGNPLKSNVTVGSIAGGRDTDPLWKSDVSNADFRQALTLSLQQHAMLSDAGGLTLKATLMALDQPSFGISMTVTSTVNYEITDAAGTKVFEERVVTPYTAEFSDSALGVERLRLANEGSVRANIRAFIERVVAASKTDPARFGGGAATSSLQLFLG